MDSAPLPSYTTLSPPAPLAHVSLDTCFMWYYKESDSQWTGFSPYLNRVLSELYLAGLNLAFFEHQSECCTITFGSSFLFYSQKELASPKTVMVTFHPAPPASFTSYLARVGHTLPICALNHLRAENSRKVLNLHQQPQQQNQPAHPPSPRLAPSSSSSSSQSLASGYRSCSSDRQTPPLSPSGHAQTYAH